MKLVFINLLTVDEFCITNGNDFYLAEHLAYDNADVLIIDRYALRTVYGLDFVHKVILKGIFTKNIKNIAWIRCAVTQLLAGFYFVTVAHKHMLLRRNKMFKNITEFVFNGDNTLCL